MNEKKEKRVQNIQYLKDQESEKVDGIFHLYEVGRPTLDFDYRKFDLPIESYSLENGKKYTLPLCVANYLNTSGRTVVNKLKVDESGKRSNEVGRIIARYSFEFTSFIPNACHSRADELVPNATFSE